MLDDIIADKIDDAQSWIPRPEDDRVTAVSLAIQYYQKCTEDRECNPEHMLATAKKILAFIEATDAR
jgi:hypothetical protein